MIRAVIFDMDGLMFDTERLAKEIWMELGRENGFVLSDEFLMGLCGLNAASAEKRFQEIFGEGFDFAGYSRRRLCLTERYLEQNGVPIKPGLLDLLSYLRDHGYPRAVATSTARDRAEFCLKKAGVFDCFDAVVCGDMVERGKPDPEIFLTAAALLKVPAEECLVLEDSLNGVCAAKAAGMKPVMVPDLIAPTKEVVAVLWAKLEDLNQVIPLLEADRASSLETE